MTRQEVDAATDSRACASLLVRSLHYMLRASEILVPPSGEAIRPLTGTTSQSCLVQSRLSMYSKGVYNEQDQQMLQSLTPQQARPDHQVL